MKQEIKDLIQNGKVKIHVPTPEISARVQKALFELGCKWFSSKGPSHLECKALFVDHKGISKAEHVSSLARYPENTEVNYQDIIGPSLPFQVGDKVRAFGHDGVVTAIDSTQTYSVGVSFPDIFQIEEFTADGRDRQWHKTASLELIERPAKTEKRKFYVWTRDGEVLPTIMDDTYRDVKGKGQMRPPGDYKKIPGTEITLEVTL